MCLMAFPIMAQNAARCEGGSLITGANNHEYCVSDITMNWWSAHSWCRAQGRTLATVTQACAGNAGTCFNIRDGQHQEAQQTDFWTTTPDGVAKAWKCTFRNANISSENRNKKDFAAICF